MKKSEMITKIEDNICSATSKYEISLVLELALKYGMAPTINEEKSFQIKENGEMTYEVREWEPE